jgi:di/tricarboxylate transporter
VPGEFTPQQLAFFAILLVAFALLITERLRNDLVAVLIVLSLAATGVLSPSEALEGFSSEPAIVVAGIFVLSAGLHHTGLSDTIGGWIGRLAGSSLTRAIAVIMPSVAFFSAFTHHLTTTAVMLPVTLNLSRERGIPASKLLMPLSFAASLGTTITIIGAPAFLIASSVLQQAGHAEGLGIFSIAPVGLSLSLVGTLFVLLVGRFLLPTREGTEDPASRFRLDEYFTELTVLPDSPFVGKTAQEVEADDRYELRVVGWVRGGRHRRASDPSVRFESGDVLLVRTTPESMVAVRAEPGVELHPVQEYGEEAGAEGDGDREIAERLVQAIVAPGSDLIGSTIGSVDFRERYGAVVVGLWRRRGWINRPLAKIRLRPGDVLVVQGDPEALARMGDDRAFLMMVPFQGETQLRRKAPLAGVIMLATIVAAATNLLSIEIATLAGAAAMVLSGCITAGQAYRAIDARIFVFIAGAIPLGAAMQKTGAADMLAGWLGGAVGGLSQTAILLIIFAIVAVLTQFMSDAATTALFAPVAVALGQSLGKPLEPYAVTVAMAAVASFLTPIGHHGNLLIYGPGGYHFRDFVWNGTPLTILVAFVVVFVSQWVWGF